MKKDLRELPKIRDSLSYLYVEHAKIEQDNFSIAIFNKRGKTPVPCASLSLLMLGPGTSITHAAIRALADNGCLVSWNGEEGVRFYSQGLGETRSSRHLIHQAYLVSHPELRKQVVINMYEKRFGEEIDPDLTIQQIRGKEGARVRNAYKDLSESTGVPWDGRKYNVKNWKDSDPINRAISAANACLYGLCHTAIVSIGYSPGLGFIHTGKQLSFVYDIADIYKVKTILPLAFSIVKESHRNIGRRIRAACRDYFYEKKLLKHIIPDIQEMLNIKYGPHPVELTQYEVIPYDLDSVKGIPGGLWDPKTGNVKGGQNYSEDETANN